MKKELQEMGFSEKEAGVYLALLELGSAVVTDIADRAGIKRPTTYVVLDELTKRGLANFTERRGVKVYSAVSPEHLVDDLRENAEKYEKLAASAKKLIPKWKKQKSAGESKPKVQIFEGSAGIKTVRTVYEDTLSSLESIRAHALKRGEVKTSPVSAGEIGTLPEIAVQGNKIILVSPEEKFAAVVESPELAGQLQKILKSAKKGKHSKRYSPKLGRESNL